MRKKDNGHTYKVGTVHWRRGYQGLDKVLPLTEDGDRILFPSRITEIKEQATIHNSVLLEGSKTTILHIPNNQQQEGFNQQGLYFPGKDRVTLRQLIFELDPETYAIDVPSSYTGELILDQIETRYKRRLLYADNRPMYPSLRVHGHGTLRIQRSTLEFITIDAPDMIVYIEQSTIGSFENTSLIRAKEVHSIDSHINNCQISSENGTVTDLKTNGGVALQGTFKLARTHLLPLEPARPELYPQALTYLMALPGSVIHIKDILSKPVTKPPYYRHFDFRQSEVTISGTDGLKEQLLDNVLTKSKVHVKGGKWLIDPTPQELEIEHKKLNNLHQIQT